MLVNQKQLKRIMVETQSGQFLGYVSDFELETDTGSIEKYHVSPKNLLPGLFGNSLIINKAQIINFDDEKMVVEDAVVKAVNDKKVISKVNKLESTEPVVTAEES